MKKVKNSWSEGLIMDFAPENTSPNSLTSALNATILTYNGNEMMLQNDIGNARIETAFLPEGYIPVGTCEYGDIIYVVSYNPLINKSQIGCFPSPERNISSDEVSNLGVSLSNADFLETADIIIENEQNGEIETQTVLTGYLKSSTVKKIVYDKNLQPGDKYFIYLKDGEEDSFKNFSDYDGEGLNSFQKYLKAHVVSILDDGKIELLDSSVKWYDKYFIPTIKQESGKYDIDSYRDALSSGYSIFSSKISGKLALLVELEKITGFNCTYNVYPNEDKYKVYWNISWSTDNNDINPKYIVLTKSSRSDERDCPIAYPNEGYYYKKITSTLKNISEYTYTEYLFYSYANQITLFKYDPLPAPPGTMPVFSKRIIDYKKAIPARYNNLPIENDYYLDAVSSSIEENNIIYKNAQGEILKPEYVNDDIINNYFKSSVYKEFADFDLGNYIYNYEITPAMPYGLLEEYAILGSIDFSKVGKDFIELHTWKYYNTEDYATLTLGLDAYVSENKAITGIDLKFYDAHGLSAVYTINNKESYSGTFTEYIPLNGINTSPKLINRDNTLIIHKGNSLNDLGITELLEGYLYETDERLYIINIADDQNPHLSKKEDIIYIDPASENFEFNKCFINDSGILYSNILYGVEIIIKYYYLDSLGNYDTTDESSFKREYRWMWTNQMLNPQYKYLKDFKDAVGDLILDVDAYYNINDKWFKNQYLLDYGLQETNNSQELYKNLSANVQEVSEGYNIDGNIVIKLKDNYNTFKLNAGEENADSILKSNTKLFVYEGASHIENIEGTVIQTDESKFDIFNGIYPIDNNDLSTKPTENIYITNPIFGEIISGTTLYYYKNTTGEIESSSTLPTNIEQYSLYSKPIPITIGNISNIDKIVITLTSDYVLNFDKSITEQPNPQTMSVLSEGLDITQRIPINGFGSNINIGIGGSNNSSNESTGDSSNDTSTPIITGGYKPDNTPIEDLEDIPLDPNWTDIGTIGCNTQPRNYLYTLEFNKEQIQNNLIYIRIPYELKFIETGSSEATLKNIYPEIRILNTKYYSSFNFILINGVKLLDGSYIYMSNNVLTILKPAELPTEQNEELSGEQNEELPTEQIELIPENNASINVLKAGGLVLPTVDLNTENWDEYKNQYYLNIKNSTEQPNVNINYITSTNQEINILNTYGIDLTNQMNNYLEGKPIPLKYAFSGVHYSKYYKEVLKTTKQLQILVPLLNTVLDLSKYNLRIGEDQKLYFSQFVGMGVGYGDHSHRRITLYLSNNTTVGNKTITHYVSNGGSNKIGITKYSSSHQYWSLWQTKLSFDSGEECYLKDLINGIVPVLFGNENGSDPTTIKIVEDYNRDIEIIKSSTGIELPASHTIPTISANGYSFKDSENKIGLCSFLMKDVNGDIHALNNLFPLIVNDSNDSNEITQSVNTNDTIGNLIASPLSNMYIISNQYSDLSSNYISNIVHLRNQKSKFTKDLIYKFSILLDNNTQFEDLILICGVSLKTYITNIKNKCPGLSENLVNIGISDIIKNIPMLFEFDYIEPDKSIINDEIKKVYIRKSNNDFYSIEPINYNLEQNSIYFINTNNIIEKLHSYILFKNIESVILNDNGVVKFNYYDTWRTHPDMGYFTYKNNMLTLVNTNYPSSLLYGIRLNERNEGISGIVKNEYLTIEGKYA